MITQIVTTSETLNSDTELAIIPIASLVEPIDVYLPEGTESQTMWIKCVGHAGDMNVTIGTSEDDELETDTGLDTLNSAGASRLMYFTGGQWIFLTYM